MSDRLSPVYDRLCPFRGVTRETVERAWAAVQVWDAFVLHLYPDMPAPWVFADEEGGVTLEWETEGYGVRVDVKALNAVRKEGEA